MYEIAMHFHKQGVIFAVHPLFFLKSWPMAGIGEFEAKILQNLIYAGVCLRCRENVDIGERPQGRVWIDCRCPAGAFWPMRSIGKLIITACERTGCPVTLLTGSCSMSATSGIVSKRNARGEQRFKSI